jgi:hypothetical protein
MSFWEWFLFHARRSQELSKIVIMIVGRDFSFNMLEHFKIVWRRCIFLGTLLMIHLGYVSIFEHLKFFGGGGLQFFWHPFDDLFRFCGYVWEFENYVWCMWVLKIKEWYRLNNLNLFLCIRESIPFKKEGALENCEVPTAHYTSNFIQHTFCCLQLWQKKHVT